MTAMMMHQFDHYFCNSFNHITLLIELSVVPESSNRIDLDEPMKG